MLEPRKRTALDGKVWWCVFDTIDMKWSTLTCFGKYETRKECQLAIDSYLLNLANKWEFRKDILNHYINGASSKTFKDAENRLNTLEIEAKESFINGYCDGHGQAIENVRYNIVSYLEEHAKISIDSINEICDMCSKINYEDLK